MYVSLLAYWSIIEAIQANENENMQLSRVPFMNKYVFHDSDVTSNISINWIQLGMNFFKNDIQSMLKREQLSSNETHIIINPFFRVD